MPHEPRIFVLGSFIVDLAFRCRGMPADGETRRADDFAMGPGGKGTNQAIAASRSGASVSLLTAVGSDHLSTLAEEVLDAEQMSKRLLHRFSQSSTGAAFIYVDSVTGENRIIVYTGANEQLKPEHVRAAEDEIASCTVFLTQLEQPLETARVGLELARRHGVTTILNPAPALALERPIIELCDIVTPNETEIASLTGLPVESDDEIRAAARSLKAKGARNVVVTLGGRGAYVLSDTMEGFVSSYVAPKVVDTAGAGDAFNGAMASALASGSRLDQAVNHGCAAGALCVAAPGTAPAMPSAARIADMMAGRVGASRLIASLSD